MISTCFWSGFGLLGVGGRPWRSENYFSRFSLIAMRAFWKRLLCVDSGTRYMFTRELSSKYYICVWPITAAAAAAAAMLRRVHTCVATKSAYLCQEEFIIVDTQLHYVHIMSSCTSKHILCKSSPAPPCCLSPLLHFFPILLLQSRLPLPTTSAISSPLLHIRPYINLTREASPRLCMKPPIRACNLHHHVSTASSNLIHHLNSQHPG